MPKRTEEEITLTGHLIDSQIMANVLDKIIELGGDFDILDFRVGKTNEDPSRSRILVKAKSQKSLDLILERIRQLGAEPKRIKNVSLKPAPKDRVLPDNFYSTTNHQTNIKINGKWLEVDDSRMDCVIVVDRSRGVAYTKKLKDVKKGDMIVVGSEGIKVIPPEKPRERSKLFDFMVSKVSSEKPSETVIRQIAEEIKKLGKGKMVVVAGPAVVHTGGAERLASLIRKGYVRALLSGNALATHDIEYATMGTSLGMDLSTGAVREGGHRHHLIAINLIRKEGSILDAVRNGRLGKGIMYECIKNGVPFVLAGSIRDDGPLPEVTTDALEAQSQMVDLLRGADIVLMLASTLHSIAVGNLLSSGVKTVCVDINPAVVTKLIDRGSAQAVGVIEDVGLFLAKLDESL